MKKSLQLLLSAFVLIGTWGSLSAQMMETNPKTFSNFYHVPNVVTHRLQKVSGFNDNEDFVYHYNGHNDLIRVDHFQEGNLVTYYNYIYNDKKQCTEIEQFSTRASFDEPVKSMRECFEYGDNGELYRYVRWFNHNTDPQDLTLVEDQIITIQYNKEGLPSTAHVRFLDPQSFELYDSFDISLEYNAKGQLFRRLANYPDGQGLFENEVITFDDKGEYMEMLTLTNEQQEITEWQFTRDDKTGNVLNLGRAGFIFQFEFVPGQAAAKTFYPRENLAKLFLYGFRNYTYLSIPLLYNGSKEAVAKHITQNGTFIYEENKPTSIDVVTASTGSNLQSTHDAWIISEASSPVMLYSLEGSCLQVVTPRNGVATISKVSLAEGNYIIKSDSKVFKVIR